jgi:hypothetical protein
MCPISVSDFPISGLFFVGIPISDFFRIVGIPISVSDFFFGLDRNFTDEFALWIFDLWMIFRDKFAVII